MIKEIFAPVVGTATRTVYRRIAVASAIAGLIVAAIILMTPNVFFEQFIVATGLPGAIDAAAPPLGVKARLAFAFIAAGGIAAIAFAIFSLVLARKGSDRSNRRSPEDEFFAFTPPAPRRRADSHPDAPPRPPINAGDDLGIPLDLVDVVTEESEADRAQPEQAAEPVWLEQAEEAEQVGHVENGEHIEGGEVGASEEWTEPDFVDEFEPVEQAQPEEFVPSVPSASPDEEESFGRPARDGVEIVPPVEGPDAPNVAMAAEPSTESVEGELMDLVARLEAGLARRRRTDSAANDRDDEAGRITPHPVTRSGRDGELQGALRDALDALQKLNANG